MMKFSKLLLACLVAFGMCACSSEKEDGPDQPENTSDLVYMNIRLSMPNTRSATDGVGDTNSDANPDSEVGLERENAVTSAIIALTNSNYDVLAQQHLTSLEQDALYANQVYTVTFEAASVTGLTGQLYVVAVCNPASDLTLPSNLKDLVFNTDAADASVVTGTGKNAFLMTNATIGKPVTAPDDWKPYYSKSNPFNLGIVEVERAAVRFDYKAVEDDNKYTVLNDKTTGTATMQVQLTEVALINESKSFYGFRRVSDTGLDANTTLCGVETPTNYVVDTDASWKQSWTAASDADASHFYYTMTSTIDNWEWTELANLSTSDSDNWGSKEYKIWRYAYENTIPADPTTTQKNGITTGVVFKGKLVIPEGSGFTITDKTQPIYVFQNVVYGNWSQVETAAKKANAMPALAVAYEKANTVENGPSKGDVAQFGFTRYMPDNGEYYMYYYYWNRHNDNLKPAEMGPMEFCVVRNNVYKLAVTSISNFGHPEPNDPDNPGGDPDPVKPTDPDEEINIYFNVSVKVLPWVVRVNNIEF